MSNPVNRGHRANGGVSANNDQRNRPENPTPDQLIKSLKLGESVAYDQLVGQRNAQLKSFLFKLLSSREDAEDVAQETFIQVWQKREYLSEKIPVDAFLYHIARAKAIDKLREKKRFHSLMSEEQYRFVNYSDSAEYVAEVNEAQAKLDKAIATMPKMMRAVYNMKFIQGRENNEIADELSITTSTVRTQIERATKKIHEIFSSD